MRKLLRNLGHHRSNQIHLHKNNSDTSTKQTLFFRRFLLVRCLFFVLGLLVRLLSSPPRRPWRRPRRRTRNQHLLRGACNLLAGAPRTSFLEPAERCTPNHRPQKTRVRQGALKRSNSNKQISSEWAHCKASNKSLADLNHIFNFCQRISRDGGCADVERNIRMSFRRKTNEKRRFKNCG